MLRPVNLWFALLGLGSNKLRSALTTLGIIIGVGAVIVIVSLGAGLRRSTEQQMEAWSGGTIEVRPGGRYGGVMPMIPEGVPPEKVEAIIQEQMRSMRASQLGPADVEALEKLATTVVAVAPQVETWGQVVCQGVNIPGQIVGVTEDFTTVYRREVKWGRFLTPEDDANAAAVAVLDETLVTQYFGEDANPVGQVLHITMQDVPQNFVVVGVLRKKAGMDYFGPRAILVPLKTAQLRLNPGAMNPQLGGGQSLSLIAARVDSRVPAERRYAVAQINTILRARRGIAPGAPEDFQVHDTLEFSEEATRLTNTITAVLSLIAGISLIVGSIGLMNIMLVSVSERTWEIGLRRALGARQIDILGQFLTEAVLLSLGGGLVGLVLGAAGSYGISLLVEQLRGLVWVTADVVLIAMGVSSAVGIAAGLYPAWRAALLAPTSALRHS
jgi:putative ABC transport system permease protein